MQGHGGQRQLGSAVVCTTHRAQSGVPGSSSFSSVSGRPVCVGAVRQHHGCGIHRPSRWIEVLPSPREDAQALMWVQTHFPSLRAAYVPWVRNFAADMPPRDEPREGDWHLHPRVVQQLWARFGGAQVDLFASQETADCPGWFSRASPPGPRGLDTLTRDWPLTRPYVSSISSDPGDAGQSRDGRSSVASDSPTLAETPLVQGATVSGRGDTMAIASEARPALAGSGGPVAPTSRPPPAVGLAPERRRWSGLGLPEGVLHKLQGSTLATYRVVGTCSALGARPTLPTRSTVKSRPCCTSAVTAGSGQRG